MDNADGIDLFDERYYEINADDVRAVTVTRDMMDEDVFDRCDKVGQIPEFNPDTIRAKYKGWCAKFKKTPPRALVDPDCVVVGFGIPAIDDTKMAKFQKYLKMKISAEYNQEGFLKINELTHEKLQPVIIPVETVDGEEIEGEDKPPRHYIPVLYITCINQAISNHVEQILDGMALTGGKKLSACLLSQIDFFYKRNIDEFDPPNQVKVLDPSGLGDHLDDATGREQFLIATSDKVSNVNWNDPVLNVPQEFCKPLTCLRSSFSTNGSFVFTMHRQGVKVRGGPNLDQVAAFPHEDVWETQNSPDERWLISWDGLSNTSGTHKSVKIWDLWTATLAATHWCPPQSPCGTEFWPFFIFSSCSRYLACNNGSDIIILEAPTWKPIMIEKSIYKINIRTPKAIMSWSPTDPYLAIWTPPVGVDDQGFGNGPCSLKVVNIDKKIDIATKSLNVEIGGQSTLQWHPQGNFLSLMLQIQQRVSKKTRKTLNRIEVFHMRIHGCPADSIIIPTDTAKVHEIAFEPQGDRLAVLMEDRLKVWSLKRDASKAQTTEICTKSFGAVIKYNTIKWSPQGTFFVLAGLDISDYKLSFNSLKKEKGDWKIDESHQDSHWSMNKVEWDPSGRYVASVVSLPPNGRHDFGKAAESSYAIWTFQGKALTEQKPNDTAILNFEWRPQPKEILTADKMKDILGNIAKYGAKYGTDDDRLRSAALSEQETTKKSLLHKFQSQIDLAQKAMDEDPIRATWEQAWRDYNASITDIGYDEDELDGRLSVETVIIKPVA